MEITKQWDTGIAMAGRKGQMERWTRFSETFLVGPSRFRLKFLDWYKESSFTKTKILADGIWFCQLLYIILRNLKKVGFDTAVKIEELYVIHNQQT